MAENAKKQKTEKGKLYHVGYHSSSRVLQLIYELDLENVVEVVNVDEKFYKGPEFLKINPNAKIPAYTEGDFTLVESAAIFNYLLEKYDTENKLKVLDRSDLRTRGKYSQFLLYGPASLYTTIVPIYMQKNHTPEDKRDQKLIDEKMAEWAKCAAFLKQELGTQNFLLGDEFSAADLIISYDIMTADFIGVLEGHPTLQAYARRLAQRPSYLKCYPHAAQPAAASGDSNSNNNAAN